DLRGDSRIRRCRTWSLARRVDVPGERAPRGHRVIVLNVTLAYLAKLPRRSPHFLCRRAAATGAGANCSVNVFHSADRERADVGSGLTAISGLAHSSLCRLGDFMDGREATTLTSADESAVLNGMASGGYRITTCGQGLSIREATRLRIDGEYHAKWLGML